MSAVWTITFNGTEQSCADWGLTARPIITTRDRSPTKISFRMAAAAPEGGIPFPHYMQLIKSGYTVTAAEALARIVIKQNRTFSGGSWSGTGYVFTGYLTTQHGRTSGTGQGINLEFQDAIWLMQNTTFQQLWNQNVSFGAGLTVGVSYKILVVGGTNFVAVGASSNTVGVVFTASGVGSGVGLGVVQTQVPVSRVVLFLDLASYIASPGAIQSAAWEMNEIITYAAACGIYIQAGSLSDYNGWYTNYYQAAGITCWSAMLKCMEPIASAKVWIDGSTTPPTLNVRSRTAIAALTAPTTTAPGPVTLPYKGTDSAGRKHIGSDLIPRYDLIPPQVVCQYQTNNTVNGLAAPTWGNDVYPATSTGNVPFALVVPINLAGASTTAVTGQLDCEALACVGGTHAAKRAWWASKRGGEHGKLADYKVRFQTSVGAAVAIGDATVTDDSGASINLTNYPNRIVSGTYHSWMKLGGTTQINCVRAKVSVKVACAEYDVDGATPADTDMNGNRMRFSASQVFECHILLTNAPTGVSVYTAPGAGATGAETAATGLAQNIYTDRQTLDYDGEHEIVDKGTSSRIPLAQIIGHWNVLNISGGDSAWATANMTIGGTEIDLMTNHQRIEIGPSKHLSPQDWKDVLFYFRNRTLTYFAGSRGTGYGSSSQNVDMAHNTPDANTVEGLKVDSAVMFLAPDPVDTTRSLGFNQDATTGQIAVVQQKTSDNTNYTTGLIVPEYTGTGAPGPSTLATNAYYRVRDRYLDTTNNVQYYCKTAGDKSSSVWQQIGGGGGGAAVWV